MPSNNTDYLQALSAAADRANIDDAGAELIRIGANALYRLPGHIVARISRPRRQNTAAKEVAVARWLEQQDLPAVQPLSDVRQPILINDQAVTFWHELPPHRSGTLRDVGSLLRKLHSLPPPREIDLPRLMPFLGIADQIQHSDDLDKEERSWLTEHLQVVEAQSAAGIQAEEFCVIHGDAHTGNVVTANDGTTVLLDFERVALGPPAWDLVSIAVLNKSAGWITDDQYQQFVDGYGKDVTKSAHYPALRDIRELRMTCYITQLSQDHARAKDEASLRIACLRGQRGSRPWPWAPM